MLYAWGDPTGVLGQIPGQPAYKDDASNTAIEQALQSGAHHDGMYYFPRSGRSGNQRGILCINHEYDDQDLLFPDGMDTWDLEKVRKSQHAHGVSVIEVWVNPRTRQWEVKRPSPFARRIHGNTPMQLTGPAAGDDLMKTDADPNGTRVLGTLNNCANGFTPWGTYLTCEENWNGYFANPTSDVVGVPGPDQKQEILSGQSRYGISQTGFGYRWHEHDPRFLADENPNEPNRFGYVVEIDPMSPRSRPKKRTALGRLKHENAEHVVAGNGKVVVYMGDDERNEYIYKFVTDGHLQPEQPPREHGPAGFRHPLRGQVQRRRHGRVDRAVSLYRGACRLDPGRDLHQDPSGRGRRRRHHDGPPGVDQRQHRQALERLLHPHQQQPPRHHARVGQQPRRHHQRGLRPSPGGRRQPARDQQLRPHHPLGRRRRGQHRDRPSPGTSSSWRATATAPTTSRATSTATTSTARTGSGSTPPAGCGSRPTPPPAARATTRAASTRTSAPTRCCAPTPRRGEIRRFLTGPRGCEVTGVTATPDLKTMFVNLQHPGEGGTTANPTAVSDWPDRGARPRSATIVITRDDGGEIGGL